MTENQPTELGKKKNQNRKNGFLTRKELEGKETSWQLGGVFYQRC